MHGIVSQTKMRAFQENVSNYYLANIACQWDPKIRHELHEFANKRWPGERILGLLPIHSYRLRKQSEPGIYIWWVERDIPPYDRYRCAAYRVELSLAETDQPRWIVRSGTATYPIIPISIEGLKAALVKMNADTPLVIRRHFGPALDP